MTEYALVSKRCKRFCVVPGVPADNAVMAAPHDDTSCSTFGDDGAPTGLSVDASDPRELQFWSDVWNVSAEEVRQAVRYVGTEADSVSRYLGLQRRAATVH